MLFSYLLSEIFLRIVTLISKEGLDIQGFALPFSKVLNLIYFIDGKHKYCTTPNLFFFLFYLKISCTRFSDILHVQYNHMLLHTIVQVDSNLKMYQKPSRSYFRVDDNRLQCLQDVLIVLNLCLMV